MSALLAPGQTPSTDDELIRSFHDRIRALETAPTARVGDWVLSDLGGALTASSPAGGIVALTGLPEAVDFAPATAITGMVTTPQLEASNDNLLSQLIKALTGGVFGGTIDQLLSWVEKIPFLNLLTGFLDGSIIPGLDASKIISGQFGTAMINGLVDFLGNVENLLTSLPFGGIVGGLVGFWANAVNALLGLGGGGGVIPAYKPENSAIANVQGQINTIQAQISATGDGAADGFNTSPLDPANWDPIYGVANVQAAGYVWNVGGAGDRYTCQRWKGVVPQTTHYQVQMTIILPQNGGATSVFGQHRFGAGGNSTLSGFRFPCVEMYVDQFGARIRLGSLTGPLNDFNLGSNGYVQYGEINYGANLKTGDVLALEVDESIKLYRLYLNPGPGSDPILNFLDNTNTIVRGVGHRFPFFQLNVLNDAFGVGNGWDNFYLFDR